MLLSLKQRYVVSVLNRLGCIRRDQLFILTRDRFKTEDFTLSESQMDALLRQLPYLVNAIRVENDVVRYSAVNPEALRLEAIDVMLELSNGFPVKYDVVQDSDILLEFSLGCHPPRRYTVAVYTGEADLHDDGKAVVWIAKDSLPPETISLAKNQYYAQRQEDGSHRFFGASK